MRQLPSQVRLLFTVFLTIPLLACNTEGELQGSVFIVTKGAQNYKLGLIDVKAIPEEKIVQFLQDKKATIRAKFDAAKAKSIESEPAVDQAKRQLDEAKRSFELANSEYAKLELKVRELSNKTTGYDPAQPSFYEKYELTEPAEEKARKAEARKFYQLQQSASKQLEKYKPAVDAARRE